MNKGGRTRWILAFIWASWIFATSSAVIHSKEFIYSVVHASDGKVSQESFQRFWQSWWWVFVKGYHVLEYFNLTLCLLFAVSKTQWSFSKKLPSCGVAAVLYASSDEYHQTFVPTRGGKWTDVVIDTGGVSLAILLSWTFHKILARKAQMKPLEIG